ncbi:hypothetical protein NN561_001348 [Cricetulus griseus]
MTTERILAIMKFPNLDAVRSERQASPCGLLNINQLGSVLRKARPSKHHMRPLELLVGAELQAGFPRGARHHSPWLSSPRSQRGQLPDQELRDPPCRRDKLTQSRPRPQTAVPPGRSPPASLLPPSPRVQCAEGEAAALAGTRRRRTAALPWDAGPRRNASPPRFCSGLRHLSTKPESPGHSRLLVPGAFASPEQALVGGV